METALVAYQTTVQQLHHLNYIVVEVPPAILEQLPGKVEKGNYNQRLIVRLDDRLQWQCGMLAMGEGSGCIPIQAKRLKALGKTLGDTVRVELFKDESEYGVEVAEELAIYWEQEPEAFRRFSNLTPSVQRYVLNYIITVKSPEKRLERTVLLMRNLLREPEGKETFRGMLGRNS